MEGEFTDFLRGLEPSRDMFELARKMFRDIWDHRHGQAQAQKQLLKQECQKLEEQVESLMERLVEADSPSLISAYEKQIEKLERQKLLTLEKCEKHGQSRHSFTKMFEHAMTFLSNPCKIWENGNFYMKRTVLRLAFAQKITYSRGEGLRTPKTTLPFKALEQICTLGNKMADRQGFEPWRRLPAYTRSRRAPSTTRPPVHLII